MIVVSALWSGLLAGMLLTAAQSIQVEATLIQAEIHKNKTDAPAVSNQIQVNKEAQMPLYTAESQPKYDWKPTFFSALTNISLGIGFAILMGVVSNIRGGISNWRRGLIWGLAGYAIFFVAPSLGLPPEIAVTEAANLQERNTWWLMTVFDTALGLWLLVFAQTKQNKLLGAILLLSPHLMGAPQPEMSSTVAPQELINTFIVSTAIANALFWLALGGLMGRFSINLNVHKLATPATDYHPKVRR